MTCDQWSPSSPGQQEAAGFKVGYVKGQTSVTVVGVGIVKLSGGVAGVAATCRPLHRLFAPLGNPANAAPPQTAHHDSAGGAHFLAFSRLPPVEDWPSHPYLPHANASSNAWASWRSAVSKPSVNQP
jgi:hypothetical protein